MNAFLTVDEKNMSRRTYDSNRNAGDTTEQTFYSEWMLVNGSAVGQHGTPGSRSELFSAYSTTLDADRSALPVTDHALMLARTDLEYEVTRVKSPVLGRDLNPFGRGDGTYYPNGGNFMAGSLRVMWAKPFLVGRVASGYGSSINNLYPWDPWYKLLNILEAWCHVLILTCPSFLWFPPEDPCEGMDLQDPWVACCECLPLMCPDCEGVPCDPLKGCCIWIKYPEYYAFCGGGPKPPQRKCTLPKIPKNMMWKPQEGGCCCIVSGEQEFAIGGGMGGVPTTDYGCNGYSCHISYKLVGEHVESCGCSTPGAIVPEDIPPYTLHALRNRVEVTSDSCSGIAGCDECVRLKTLQLEAFSKKFICMV